VATRRSGRETVCSLRPEAFDAEVARERSMLGLDGAVPTTDPRPEIEPAIPMAGQPRAADA